MSGIQKPDKKHRATPADTRRYFFESINRPGPAISSGFIQEIGGERKPGPLRLFVRQRRLFALNLYLMLHCLALSEPWDVSHLAGAWARALGHENDGSESTVSRSWTWLEKELELVKTTRTGRSLKVFLLDEAGSGETRAKPKSHFFTLPNEYFLDDWFSKLDLAETATLLICLSYEKGQPWFTVKPDVISERSGLSRDTLRRGLDGLTDEGIIDRETRMVKDPAARYGATATNFYRLLGPFTSVKDDDE